MQLTFTCPKCGKMAKQTVLSTDDFDTYYKCGKCGSTNTGAAQDSLLLLL